jgi:protein-tyrosine-phosphatase
MRLNVIFICTGNTCRSPMAEGMLVDLLPPAARDKFQVSSAGLGASEGAPVSGPAEKVMAEFNIDVSHHTARRFNAEMARKADLILTMSENHLAQIREQYPEAAGKTFLLSSYADASAPPADIPDPIGGSVEDYRLARDEIHKYVVKISGKMQG